MGNRDTQATLDYHEATKHSERSVRASRHSLDWENQPLPFKIYRDSRADPAAARFPRAGSSRPSHAIARTSRARRSGAAGERIPDLADARACPPSLGGHHQAQAPSRAERSTSAPTRTPARSITSISTSSTAELPDLPAGVYHFGPHDFALRRLREGDYRACAARGVGRESASSPARRVVDRERLDLLAQRLEVPGARLAALLLGRGHAAREPARGGGHGSPRAASSCSGLRRRARGAAARPRPAARGRARAGGARALAAPRRPRCREIPELRLETEPLSRYEVDYPEIRAAHAASSLADGAEAAAWRGDASARATSPRLPARCTPLRPTREPQHSAERPSTA